MPFSYVVRTDRADPWAAVEQDLEADPTPDVYWTLRTFALDGRVELQLATGSFSWGGPLLDFASEMAEWLETRPASFTFRPIEQADDVRMDSAAGRTHVHTGTQAGEHDTGELTATLEMFLVRFADELARQVPRILTVPGMEWAVRRTTTGRDASWSESSSTVEAVVTAVCRLALDHRQGNRSEVDLLRRSGYMDARGEVTVLHIFDCLSKNPGLVDAWMMLADDNRSSTKWWIVERDQGRFEVAFWDGSGATSVVMFDDRVLACAVFVSRHLETIAESAESWQRLSRVLLVVGLVVIGLAFLAARALFEA